MAITRLGDRPEGLSWIKSSFSFSNSNCVEIAGLPDGGVGVRDSKDSSGPVLQFTPGEWHAFLGGARNGEFDHFGREPAKRVRRHAVVPGASRGSVLRFESEASAACSGQSSAAANHGQAGEEAAASASSSPAAERRR